jgi:hypothetical protein
MDNPPPHEMCYWFGPADVFKNEQGLKRRIPPAVRSLFQTSTNRSFHRLPFTLQGPCTCCYNNYPSQISPRPAWLDLGAHK